MNFADLRCLEDFDLAAVEVKHFDGRSMQKTPPVRSYYPLASYG